MMQGYIANWKFSPFQMGFAHYMLLFSILCFILCFAILKE